MTTLNEKLTTQWKDVGSLVLGVWLALSPWALSYASQPTPAWNAHAVGVIFARRRPRRRSGDLGCRSIRVVSAGLSAGLSGAGLATRPTDLQG
jgi:SPW repeat-containing protein